MSVRKFTLIGILISLFLVLLIAPMSSSSPDGLEKITEGKGIYLGKGKLDFPSVTMFPDYATPWFSHQGLSTAIAGIVGTSLVFLAGFAFARIISGKRKNGSIDDL